MLSTYTSGKAGFFLIGLGLLAYAAYDAYSTYRFISRAVERTGVVSWGGSGRSGTVWVELKTDRGLTERILPARRSRWTLPGWYKPGDRISILYDPQADYDAPFFPARARIASWFQLWGFTTLVSLLGLLCTSVYVLALLWPGHVNVRLSFRIDRGKT
jgi:hypothetical protein